MSFINKILVLKRKIIKQNKNRPPIYELLESFAWGF